MTQTSTPTFPISERALIQRLRRALAQEGERLLANRGGHFYTVGRYYTLDGNNIMTNHDVDLEALGRDLGVLHSWEGLVADAEASEDAEQIE